MENLQTKAEVEVARDWQYVCLGCGRIVFSMASPAKALFCRNCDTELRPVWLPLGVPRYAVPVKTFTACPHCWESIVITLPEGKVPLGKFTVTCRHCLGKIVVNLRKYPIAIRKLR